LSYNKLSPSYTSLVMSISSHIESNTYFEAMKHDCWREVVTVKYLLWSQIKHERMLFCLKTKLS